MNLMMTLALMVMAATATNPQSKPTMLADAEARAVIAVSRPSRLAEPPPAPLELMLDSEKAAVQPVTGEKLMPFPPEPKPPM